MTTTAPGLHTVKPQQVKRQRVSLPHPARAAQAHDDDDPTIYPDSEVILRDEVETDIASELRAVLKRYLAERGRACFVGSDSFIYWVKGDITACVAPDVYILPEIPPNTKPRKLVESKGQGTWRTWIHPAVPSFALEVKAFGNPRKDELQSPARHDALGTKELVVFDPFAHRRRKARKRFVVWRRDANGKLVIVHETNDDRVFCEELNAFLVAQGEGDDSLLRLGLGPNGEQLLPFESELVEMQAQRAEEESRRAEREACMRQEEARRASEEARRADEEARRADEATRLARETALQMAKLEAELAQLRAGTGKRRKR